MASEVREVVLAPAMRLLLDQPMVFQRGPVSDLLSAWESLCIEVSGAIVGLGEDDPLVPELRAIDAAVGSRLAAWRAGMPMTVECHDDLALTVERHTRRLLSIENGTMFDEPRWIRNAWWQRAAYYSFRWSRRIQTFENQVACAAVLKLTIAAAQTADPAALSAVLAEHPDDDALRRWLVVELVDHVPLIELERALTPIEVLGEPERQTVLLRDGLPIAQWVLLDVADKPDPITQL